MSGNKRTLDFGLFVLCISLCLVGLVFVQSASFPSTIIGEHPDKNDVYRQGFFFLLGLVAMLGIFHIPMRWYRRFAFLFLLLSLVLGGMVFTPLGTNLGTFSRRWIQIGSLTFMPSDMIKICGVLAMARFLSGRHQLESFREGTIPAMLLIGICALPVALQPDTSTTFIIGATLFCLFTIYGMNLWHLIPSMVAAVTLLIVYLFKDAYRIERIKAVLNPFVDYYGDGWQLAQSLFAVTRGGIFGRGLGKSAQKFSNLSEAHNDFIFAIISEEIGFVGSVFVLALIILLVVRIIKISLHSKDRFSQITGVGIAALIALQSLINIGVSLGLVPPTGVPLPFISNGGTSLLVSMAMIGIVLRIGRENKERKAR